jgi:sugar phosphate permease
MPLSQNRLDRQGLWIFLLLCVVYLFVPFHRVSPAVMAVDIMHDMGLGAPAMGLLASVFFFTYGAMQLPSGLLADSLGPRKTLPLFFSLAGFGALLFGMADTVLGLVIGRALMGFGVSVIFICGIKLISRWFPPMAFARMSGIYLGVGGLGLILGSGPTAALCALTGWRMGLMLSGGVGLILCVALWIWVRDTPEELGLGSPLGPSAAGGTAPRAGVGELWRMVRRICSHRGFWLIALWFFCQFSIHMSFGGLWGGPYLMDVHGLSRTGAGNVLNMMGLGMLAGGPLTGWLSDSVFRGRRPVMLLNSLCLGLLFLVLALWGRELPLWALYAWFFGLAAFGMGSLSVGFASVRDLFGDQATGTGGGLLNTFPSFGVVLFQPLTGWILENQGRTPAGGFSPEAYSLACALYVGVALVGLAGAALAREPMRREA